jgi:hypothetical protein
MKKQFSTFSHFLNTAFAHVILRNISSGILLLLPLLATSQQQVSKEIQSLLNRGANFQTVSLLQFESTDLGRQSELSVLQRGTLLKTDSHAITELLNNPSPLIRLDIPVASGRNISLDLVEHHIFSPDFEVYTSDSPGSPMNYAQGKHFKGIIHGDPESIVAISVFENEINGLISMNGGNLMLGKVADSRENLHILYNDIDLKDKPVWECGTLDDGIGYTDEQLLYQGGQRDPGDCIRVYVEIDDTIVIHMGGATHALNFITSTFNQTITLYANEDISMSVSEILVWTTPSPYNGTTASQMLTAFQNNTGVVNGDLGHLVSFNAMGNGVAAGFDGICNSNPDLSKCFSGIFPVYAVVPAWSWAVNVIAHEMGHLIGSRHTHACVWNFNNTAIDGCSGVVEGNCQLPGIPPEGGTIMSYCHNTNVGTKFNLGFGTQPGNVLRNTVKSLGNCLSNSCIPASPQYCWSAGSQDQPGHAFWIQNVTLNSINNTSGNDIGGYGDYTSQSTQVNAGGTYTLSMSAANQGVNFAKSWAAWIDYNDDLDWDDAGELIGMGNGSLGIDIAFTVPSTSPLVTTRLRVAMKRADTGTLTPCGYASFGEVEDYTLEIINAAGPSCNDGAQNGDETGVDCGGSTCPACPTCTDGIQNGNETGVDCGGSCSECPGTALFGHYFESGWDGWIDGGGDATRYTGTNSWEGNYSINLQDNSAEQSAMTSPSVNLSGMDSVKLEFFFYSSSMENGEDFLVSYYDGTSYTTVATFTSGYGGNFANNSFWPASVKVTSAQVNFTSNARFRIQCDAGDNSDDVFIDAVTLIAYGSICTDSDSDGVCDSLDVCPGFDDNLIGTACDDGNECTENDVYLGAPDCTCAGTPIPDCVPCNPQTASITPNPLTHTGTGATSTNVLSLPSGSSDAEFTISNLNAKLGGNSSGRFIDRVNVWYEAGSGAQLYGSFNGDQQSTVNVSIAEIVQSVWVTLEDGYDGNSQVTQSISFTPVIHCTTPSAPFQGGEENGFTRIESRSAGSVLSSPTLNIYPNPAKDVLYLSFHGDIHSIRVISLDGKVIIHSQLNPEQGLNTSAIPPGIYVVVIQSGDEWYRAKFIKS